MNIPSQQLDFLAFMSGEADLDELDRPECDELDEHCGEETDESDDGDSSFMIRELGDDKLLL